MPSTADVPAPSKTPYLDRELSLPRRNPGYSEIRRWQAVLLVLSLGFEVFRILYFIAVLTLVVHELGHVLGGLIVGNRFASIRVGPLRVERSGKACWQWNWGTLWSGRAATLPVSKRGIRWKLFFSTLAGPIASIVTGWVTLLVSPHDNSMVAVLGIGFAVASIFVGMLNLIPYWAHGFMSDGMRLWVLLFSKSRRDRMIAVVTFVADLRHDKATHMLEASSLERTSTLSDGTSDQVLANYAAYRQQKDHDSAAQYLEIALANCSTSTPEFREELIIEAGKYQALRRNRLDLAREWLNLETSGKPRLNRFFAEALILRGQNQLKEAIAKVDEALRHIEKTSVGPSRTAQQRAFEKWRRELLDQKAGALAKPSA